MSDIYSQFCTATEISKVNALLEKYIHFVPDNQKSKVYMMHRHAVNRINTK